MSYNCGRGTTSDSSVISRIGGSAGLILRYRGMVRKIGGKESRRGVDRCLHFTRGRIDIATQIELQRDLAPPDRTSGRHLRDAGDAGELLLERSRDRRRHDFGTGAGKTALTIDRGEIHLRQGRDRQLRIGDRARQRHRDHEQASSRPAV